MWWSLLSQSFSCPCFWRCRCQDHFLQASLKQPSTTRIDVQHERNQRNRKLQCLQLRYRGVSYLESIPHPAHENRAEKIFKRYKRVVNIEQQWRQSKVDEKNHLKHVKVRITMTSLSKIRGKTVQYNEYKKYTYNSKVDNGMRSWYHFFTFQNKNNGCCQTSFRHTEKKPILNAQKITTLKSIQPQA